MCIRDRSEDDAILSAKQKMTNELLLYEYALNHGYSCTEEEIEELMEQELVEIQSAANYDEYESYLHDLGTTYEEYWGKDVYKRQGFHKGFASVYRQALRETVSAHCNDSDFDFWHVVHNLFSL